MTMEITGRYFKTFEGWPGLECDIDHAARNDNNHTGDWHTYRFFLVDLEGRSFLVVLEDEAVTLVTCTADYEEGTVNRQIVDLLKKSLDDGVEYEVETTIDWEITWRTQYEDWKLHPLLEAHGLQVFFKLTEQQLENIKFKGTPE